jgi:hypothetical protein
MRAAWLLPLTLGALAVFWIGSGVINLVSLVQAAEQLGLAGFGPGASRVTVEAMSAVDIVLGLMVCARRTTPIALKGMALVSLAYIAIGTVWRRDLWLDPLGPLLKMLPVGVLPLAALAMLKKPAHEA